MVKNKEYKVYVSERHRGYCYVTAKTRRQAMRLVENNPSHYNIDFDNDDGDCFTVDEAEEVEK